MLFAALLLTAANAVLWVAFFIAYKKKFSTDAFLDKIRGEVNALLMDIRRETDMSATVLEGRISALKELIAESDSRVMLAAKTEKTRAREQKTLAALESPPAPRPSPPHPRELFEESAAYKPPRGTPVITRAREQITPQKSVRTAARELAAAGFSADHIAGKLGISITEARLILDLSAANH